MEMWSEQKAGILHPLVAIILILAWAFSFVLKTRGYPVVFLQLSLGTPLRMKDLTAFSRKLVFILMTKHGYSCFFPIGQPLDFAPNCKVVTWHQQLSADSQVSF